MTVQPAPTPSRLATTFAILSLASALFLFFGALQRVGILPPNPVWEAWTTADPVVRFVAVLLLLGGLLGAGSAALAMTWRQVRHMDLIAASSYLVAGIALLIGATYQPQYGASQSTALGLGAILAAGFGAVVISAWKRWNVRHPRTAKSAEPQPNEAQT